MRSFIFLSLLCWFGTTLGFQPLVSSSSLPSTAIIGQRKTVRHSFPPPTGGGDEDDNFKIPKIGIPKLKLPDINLEGISSNAIALVASLVFLLLVQKLGLLLATTYTPVLSAEDIANYANK
eukprot:CAMPEP_0194146786 /NCGR_PEP_ID=MMETSP0152-20130528/21701_1 /TAXON_ID=1049557 /ORGANISM="Thalassiothrix antarctica, Strain L6-D1" /LENGTH=120 /DNA_ID=CAMNT_0038847391 /DNA_START=80 /DNA_END=442 /DNA_ORIENTATION=+